MSARIVVLVSGSGTNLQALVDASADPEWGGTVVGVGADRDEAYGLERANRAGIPTFVVALPDFSDRDAWDAELTATVAGFRPDLVVLAGFMKLVGPRFLEAFGGRTYNTHPALLPAFPGAHAVRDALAAGATETGCTLIEVDAGVDTGRVLARAVVPVLPGDTEETLHERIKVAERAMLAEQIGELARSVGG